MTITVKALINQVAQQLFDAGVDIGIQLAAKDADVTHSVSFDGMTPEEAEFEVFERHSRATWEMKARGGAIAHIFNQDVASVE